MGQEPSRELGQLSESNGFIEKVELKSGKIRKKENRAKKEPHKDLSIVTNVVIDNYFPEITNEDYNNLTQGQKFALWTMSTSVGKNVTKDIINRIIDDINNKVPAEKTLLARMIAKK